MSWSTVLSSLIVFCMALALVPYVDSIAFRPFSSVGCPRVDTANQIINCQCRAIGSPCLTQGTFCVAGSATATIGTCLCANGYRTNANGTACIPNVRVSASLSRIFFQNCSIIQGDPAPGLNIIVNNGQPPFTYNITVVNATPPYFTNSFIRIDNTTGQVRFIALPALPLTQTYSVNATDARGITSINNATFTIQYTGCPFAITLTAVPSTLTLTTAICNSNVGDPIGAIVIPTPNALNPIRYTVTVVDASPAFFRNPFIRVDGDTGIVLLRALPADALTQTYQVSGIDSNGVRAIPTQFTIVYPGCA